MRMCGEKLFYKKAIKATIFDLEICYRQQN